MPHYMVHCDLWLPPEYIHGRSRKGFPVKITAYYCEAASPQDALDMVSARIILEISLRNIPDHLCRFPTLADVEEGEQGIFND